MNVTKTDSEKYTFVIHNETPKMTRQTAIMTIEDILYEAINKDAIHTIIVNIDFQSKEAKSDVTQYKTQYFKK